MINNVKIGADPEVFVYDIYKERHISGEGLIGGTKEEPLCVRKNYFIQEDNVALEFNIPPATSVTSFSKSIEWSLNFLRMITPDNVILDIIPYAEFEEIELVSDQASKFGCAPSYNVLLGKTCTANSDRNPLARTTAGHLHIGYDNPTNEQSTNIVKMIDLFISMPILLEDELSRKRTSVYGLNGDCRIKSYGVEARSPSNWWIKNKTRTDWCFKNIQNGIKQLNKGLDILQYDDVLINYNYTDFEKIANELKINLITNKIKV